MLQEQAGIQCRAGLLYDFRLRLLKYFCCKYRTTGERAGNPASSSPAWLGTGCACWSGDPQGRQAGRQGAPLPGSSEGEVQGVRAHSTRPGMGSERALLPAQSSHNIPHRSQPVPPLHCLILHSYPWLFDGPPPPQLPTTSPAPDPRLTTSVTTSGPTFLPRFVPKHPQSLFQTCRTLRGTLGLEAVGETETDLRSGEEVPATPHPGLWLPNSKWHACPLGTLGDISHCISYPLSPVLPGFSLPGTFVHPSALTLLARSFPSPTQWEHSCPESSRGSLQPAHRACLPGLTAKTRGLCYQGLPLRPPYSRPCLRGCHSLGIIAGPGPLHLLLLYWGHCPHPCPPGTFGSCPLQLPSRTPSRMPLEAPVQATASLSLCRWS